ncbi:MAG: ROK family protein [Pseudomonadota bacterium]
MKIGIDLGGTKTEIICLDHRQRELYRHREPSPQKNYQATLNLITRLITDTEAHFNERASIGIGIPGSLCRSKQIVKNCNSTWINGKPLKQDLENRLNREIRIANDANCFALSEAIKGVAVEAYSLFGVILGTGCGGGLVIDKKVFLGANGLAGEWGHNPLPFPLIFNETHSIKAQSGDQPVSDIYRHKQVIRYQSAQPHHAEYPGPLCYCGKRGCIETWLSGPALVADYQRVNQNPLVTEDKTAEHIVEAALVGEQVAIDCLNRYCERLAKSLAQIINIIDPDMIVLGGGMSNIELLYTEVPKRWDKYIFSDTSTTPLLKARHGDSSGVIGAALLWN